MSTIFLCHSIGPVRYNTNYNTRNDIARADGVLTFDGVYQNVYENRDLLRGRDVVLFVIGDHVGGNNRWDEGQPLEKFCDLWQLGQLRRMGCEIGWHTWTHPDLTALSDNALEQEILAPFPCEAFAYPYGKFDERVLEAVKAAGYKRAYTAGRGNGSAFQIKRSHIV